MTHRIGTLSALVSAFGLFFGLWIAALASMLGCPLVALAAGLVGLASLASIASTPSIEITESAPEASSLPTSGIFAPLAAGSLLASGLYGAAVATCFGLPLVALVAGIVATLAVGTLGASS